MSRPLKIFVWVLVPLLCGVVGLNRWLDVSGLTTSAEVRALAAQQQEGDLLIWQNLFDQRSWVKARIEHQGCPELLVLGSSTVGALRHEWFSGRRLLNGWMGAPTIEDFEAIGAVLLRSTCIPADVVVSVDHWFLNPAVDDRRWITIAADYVDYQRTHGRGTLVFDVVRRQWDLIKERFTFVTTSESVRRLVALRKEHKWPNRPRLERTTSEAFCETVSTEYYIRSADGHYTSCPAWARAPSQVQALAERYVADDNHHVREWKSVDGERLRRLGALLTLLAGRGSRITLLVPPFHPAAYAALRADPIVANNLGTMDAALAALAERVKGRFVDLRDPARSGCQAEEFEDGHHAKPSCARKWARQLERSLPTTGGEKNLLGQ